MVAANITTNALDSFGTKSPSATDPLAAMRAAGALFGLKKMPLSEFAEGALSNDDLHVVIRTDTGQALGQVGNSYECFPNEQFFGPTAEALIATGARIDRFQMLDHGRRAFMRLSWDEGSNLRIGQKKVGDIVGRRAILSTAHDGKWAGKFTIMMLRLACSNGMVVPTGVFDATLTHTVGGHIQLTDLQTLAPLIERYVRDFETAATILADTNIKPNDELCETIIQKMVDPSKFAAKKKDGTPNKGQMRVNHVRELFAGKQPESDSRAVKDTGWGLYQAGVHYFTHTMGTRGETEQDQQVQRFKSQIPGGTGNREVVKAWDVVTKGLGVHGLIQKAIN